MPGSVHLEPELLYDLAPLRVFHLEILAEGFGVGGDDVGARRLKGFSHLRALKQLRRFVLYALDDGSRSSPRREYARPQRCIVAGKGFPDARDVRQFRRALGGRHRDDPQLSRPVMRKYARKTKAADLDLATQQVG